MAVAVRLDSAGGTARGRTSGDAVPLEGARGSRVGRTRCAGAVGAALLVTAVFVGSAEDIGAGIGRGMVSETEDMYASMDEEYYGWSAGPPVAPEDINDPVAPVPGADPVLNAYAQSCFTGDYQACDDLYFESAPLSDYEQYGGTCGGRVTFMTLMACTDLD